MKIADSVADSRNLQTPYRCATSQDLNVMHVLTVYGVLNRRNSGVDAYMRKHATKDVTEHLHAVNI